MLAELGRLRTRFPKLQMPEGMLKVYVTPPASPDACVFAQTTDCFPSDFERRITPCQFGGDPDCSSCGCITSAGLEAIASHRIPVGRIFYASLAVGRVAARVRNGVSPREPAGVPPTM